MRPKSHAEALLRAWGHFYGERPPREWDEERSIGTHPIARAMEAGGEGAPAARSARSALRIRNLGVRTAKVQAWGFDAVTCSETRSHRTSVADDIPREVQRVQAYALRLHRIDTLRGTVLRYEYCTRGPQADKAAALAVVGMPTSLRQYREALAFARGWMESKLLDDDISNLEN